MLFDTYIKRISKCVFLLNDCDKIDGDDIVLFFRILNFEYMDIYKFLVDILSALAKLRHGHTLFRYFRHEISPIM